MSRLKCSLPGGERAHRGPEAGHSSGPALPEGLFYQLALGRRVDPPEGAFAWLLLRAGHFDEVPVQGQVVADRVLKTQDTHRPLLKAVVCVCVTVFVLYSVRIETTPIRIEG